MDVYSIVSERIIEKLEAGTIPWHKPWRSIGAPQNLVSKKSYRGINVWLLTMQVSSRRIGRPSGRSTSLAGACVKARSQRPWSSGEYT
jgi:antirestriction protein ArdC